MVIIKLQGGMGNQLFQYAVGWRLCRDGARTLKMDRQFLLDRGPRPPSFVYRDYDLDIFGILPADASANDYAGFCGKSVIEKDMRFIPELLTETCSLYLDGYWQTEDYFSDFAPDFRAHIPFSEALNERAAEIAGDIQSANAICLNVRRTDFLQFPSYDVCTQSYFYRGIAYVRERVPDGRVFVFSDDMDWCRTNLNLGSSTVFVDHDAAGNKFGNYFHLMTLCHHFVIPNSSFGWWAAWLAKFADKIVVTPRVWFNHPNVDTSHVVPGRWVRL